MVLQHLLQVTVVFYSIWSWLALVVGSGAVYSMAYNSTVNLIHGTGNFSSSSGTSSSTNVYKSSGSHAVTLQEQYWFSSNLLYFNIKSSYEEGKKHENRKNYNR